MILKEWWLETESNRRHGDFQSPALPTELSSHTFEELKLYKKNFNTSLVLIL
jgi:hypothetical protein